MLKLKFLYWNINNKSSPFEDEVRRLVDDNGIDVLILSENENIPASTVLGNDFNAVDLKLDNGAKKWVQVFYKTSVSYRITHHSEYTELEDEGGNGTVFPKKVNRIQVFKISGGVVDTYLACVHFPSKLHHDEITHLQLVPNYKDKVHSLTQNSKRLFIVGDFNMNPFDYGMVEPTGFYAHNHRELVSVETHKRLGDHRTLYYNPSWTLLGDYINQQTYGDSKIF